MHSVLVGGLFGLTAMCCRIKMMTMRVVRWVYVDTTLLGFDPLHHHKSFLLIIFTSRFSKTGLPSQKSAPKPLQANIIFQTEKFHRLHSTPQHLELPTQPIPFTLGIRFPRIAQHRSLKASLRPSSPLPPPPFPPPTRTIRPISSMRIRLTPLTLPQPLLPIFQKHEAADRTPQSGRHSVERMRIR
jgi:hypothetical protein